MDVFDNFKNVQNNEGYQLFVTEFLSFRMFVRMTNVKKMVY